MPYLLLKFFNNYFGTMLYFKLKKRLVYENNDY